MKIPFLSHRTSALASVVLCCALPASALTVSLQEQGSLTGFVVGGGGTVSVSPLGTDHWQVTVQDAAIGNPTGPGMNLAYTELETVRGLTAYNNILVLSVVPGTATFDVISDEPSPYAIVLPDSAVFPIQTTDIQTVNLQFTDVADSVPEPSSAGLLFGGALLLFWRARRA